MSERYACPSCSNTDSLVMQTTTTTTHELAVFVVNDGQTPQVVCAPPAEVDSITTSTVQCGNCSTIFEGTYWLQQLTPPEEEEN